MPYLTDKIQSTGRDSRAARALADENRSDAVLQKQKVSTRLPNSRFEFDIHDIETELRSHIIGQDEAISSVLQVLKTISVDIGDARKPLASLLFAGPTGVGKTETARLVARALYGDADAICRVDMNTLAQEHYSAAFTGAPPGYVGSKEGTTIFDPEKIEGTRNRPGIVLFDEIEKASNEVVLALLNVLDNGVLTVASGERTISFRNTIIFMTTNLGASDLAQSKATLARLVGRIAGTGTADAKTVILDRLLSHFPPEFVNRIDCIETFNSVDGEHIAKIIDVELGKLNIRLRKHNVDIALDAQALKFLKDRSFDVRFGARELRRTIRTYLEFPLADFLLLPDNRPTSKPAHLIARHDGDGITIERKNTL